MEEINKTTLTAPQATVDIAPTTVYQDNEPWDMVLEPKTKLLQLNLREVWRYKDLMMLFVRRDFVASFKQTILGPFWHVIQPALTTVMFLFIFTKVAQIPTNGIHPVLFYMSGITIWNYFATCLTATSNTFVGNANIFGKVYFPRLVLPFSIIISNLVRFAIQFALLVAAMAYFALNGEPVVITPFLLLLPVLVIMVGGIGLGAGIIISSLTTKYRDFIVLLGFVVQLGMYATPVAYPMSYLESKTYFAVIKANPLSPLIEAFRFSLFARGAMDWQGLLYSAVFLVVVVLLGIIIFNKTEKTFMDTV